MHTYTIVTAHLMELHGVIEAIDAKLHIAEEVEKTGGTSAARALKQKFMPMQPAESLQDVPFEFLTVKAALEENHRQNPGQPRYVHALLSSTKLHPV